MSFLCSKNLYLTNAALCVPFGIAGLACPGFTFGLFGLSDPHASTQTIIRGYASASLGFGMVYWGAAQAKASISEENEVWLLLASAAFNWAEFALQAHAGAADAGFNGMIWATCVYHGVVGLWTIYQYYQMGKDIENTKKA